jgi:sodium/potassium-transporting ATPase subunit alpha
MDNEDKQPAYRVRFGDQRADEEAGERVGTARRQRRLSRQSSIGSLSIHSTGGSRLVQPETALPITYRTLSIEIDEGQHQKQEKTKKAKDKAGVGEFDFLFSSDLERVAWCKSVARCPISQNSANHNVDAGLEGLEWHTLEVPELLRRLSVDTDQGLSEDQIKRRIGEYGRNKMTPPKSGMFGRVMGYFFGGFGAILVCAGILVFIAYKPLGKPPAPANLALACVLIAVWLIQAAFNAWQDWSTSRVMASIGTMLPDQCMVIRNGSHASISALDLVPGDIIVIKQGNKLPADVRLVEVSSDAMFDRSILTGMYYHTA